MNPNVKNIIQSDEIEAEISKRLQEDHLKLK